MNNIPFGFTPNEGQPFDMSQLGEMLQQIGQMMQKAQNETSDDGVSWSTIHDSARGAITNDPFIVDAQTKAVKDAVDLAQVWLNEATTLPSAIAQSRAWSRSDWLEATLPAWKPLIGPIAAGLTKTVTQLTDDSSQQLSLDEVPAEVRSMMEPMLQMASKMASVSTGMQVGQGLAALSAELLSSSEIGVPLSPDFVPSLMPQHVRAWAETNSLPISEAFVFVAIREAAIQRLFENNSWLRAEVADAVASYARGISFNQEHIRDTMSSIDPQDPQSMQELLNSGVFQPATTEDQQRALNRIALTLALIEGWVTSVTALAIGNRLGSANSLIETMNRRRVSGGPAEKTFGNLVGLELDPKTIRDATRFWNVALGRLGTEGRDAIWSHPDLMPSLSDLTDFEEYFNHIAS